MSGVLETLEVLIRHRFPAFALAGAAVVGLVAGVGLTKRPASAQTGAANSPPAFSETDMHGAANIGTNKDGDTIIAYGNGVVAIVHPGSSPNPSGYIHTYRISQTGQISLLDTKAFDSDSGKFIIGGKLIN